MKKLIIGAVLAAVTAVSAAELTVKAWNPWKKAAVEGEYTLVYSGEKWPTLKLDVSGMKPETYYRLALEMRSSSAEVKMQTVLHDTRDGKPVAESFNLIGGTESFTPFVFYFKTGDAKKFDLGIMAVPGAAGDVAVRKITLDEVTDFSGNLLTGGDFETANCFIPYFTADVQVVSDAGFLSGEKSLKVVKPAGGHAGVMTVPLPAIPGKIVVVKFWAKSGNGGNGYVNFDFFRHGQNRHLYKEYSFKLEPEWKEYTYEYTVPADVNQYSALKDGVCRLRLGVSKSAEAAEIFFDNVEYSIK